MPVTAINLSYIVTRSELAEALDVLRPALDFVTSANQCCWNAGCSLFEAHHNFGYCILNSQAWFLRKYDRFGKPSANRRGYGLYHICFLVYTGKGTTTYCCSSTLCAKLGYSHNGRCRFPSKPDQVATVARVLGMAAADQQRVIDNPGRYCTAPWHFRLSH